MDVLYFKAPKSAREITVDLNALEFIVPNIVGFGKTTTVIIVDLNAKGILVHCRFFE